MRLYKRYLSSFANMVQPIHLQQINQVLNKEWIGLVKAQKK